MATYSNVEFLSNALEFFATDDWSRIDVWEDMSPSGGNWLGFSPDGRFLALPSHQQMTVWAVGVGKKAVVASHDLPNTGTTVAAFSPDGRFLVCGAGRRLAILTCPGFARVADLASRRHHWRSIAFHPTGRYFAAVGNDVVVTVYDTTTWAVSKSFAWDIGKLRSIAFSPDGCLAAVGSDTGKIVVWDVDF